MNQWSPERRRRLVQLVLGTLLAMVLIWFGLISLLQGARQIKLTRLDSRRIELNGVQRSAQLAPQYRAEVEASSRRLRAAENQMARGDLFRWGINHTLGLQIDNNIDITSYRPPQLGPVEAPPPVPYQAATYSFMGYGYYHDIGAFLADFENSSPYIRVKSMVIQSTASGLRSARESEKLTFETTFVTLTPTNSPLGR